MLRGAADCYSRWRGSGGGEGCEVEVAGRGRGGDWCAGEIGGGWEDEVWLLSGLRVRGVLEAVAVWVTQVGIVYVFFFLFCLVLEIVSFFVF